MQREYSKEIANVINEILTRDDWDFSFSEDSGEFRFGFKSESKLNKINCIIRVGKGDYVLYAFSPIGVDVDDKVAIVSMTEFVCRANYGLRNGNFELDVSDGEIRYKSYVDCDGIMPTYNVVINSILVSDVMFSRYGSGIIDVIFGKTTAEKAIESCESNLR